MTRSGSTGMLVRPKAADATDLKREHTMIRSSSIGGLAAQIKSAVSGADPLAQAPGVRRPLSRTAVVRRRPAPKVITDSALQLRSGSLANLGAEGGLDDSQRSLPTPSTCCPASPGGGTSPPSSNATSGYPAPPYPRLLHQNEPAAPPGTGLVADVKGALCSVQMATHAGAGGTSEVRTKVFRVGAPLLRSTIPLSISMGRTASEPTAPNDKDAAGRGDEDEDQSDVESVRSSSELGMDDLGTLKVTLDFPC